MEAECETNLIASIQFTKTSNSNYHSCYKWYSDCESSLNVIRDSSIELIPYFIEDHNILNARNWNRKHWETSNSHNFSRECPIGAYDISKHSIKIGSPRKIETTTTFDCLIGVYHISKHLKSNKEALGNFK